METPDDCRFGVLHALDMTDMGLIEKPRRWGKTQHLIELVLTCMEAGCEVAIVCQNISIRESLISRLRKQPRTSFLVKTFKSNFEALTVEEVYGGKLIGRDMLVFTDEVTPNEFERLKPYLVCQSFVLGYFTAV